MSEALAKVQPGDAFRPNAAAHNAFVDAAQWVRGQQMATRGGGGPGGGMWPANAILGWSVNYDLERFSIVTFDQASSPPIDPSTSDGLASFLAGPPAIKIMLPWLGAMFGAVDSMWGITLEPIAAGAMGLVAVAGVVPVQIDVIKEWHFRADVIASDAAKLRSYAGGSAGVVWKQSGIGVKWALVRLGMSPDPCAYWCKLDESLAAGGEADVTLYYRGSPGVFVPTGSTDIVQVPPIYTSVLGVTMAGKFVAARWNVISRCLELDGRECG